MNKAFTLIELLVVVLIIGILTSFALPLYKNAIEESRATEAMVQGKAVVSAIQEAQLRNPNSAVTWDQLSISKPDNHNYTIDMYGGPFVVFFRNYTGSGTPSAKISLIKKIKTQRNQGLKDAKDCVEGKKPCTLLNDDTIYTKTDRDYTLVVGPNGISCFETSAKYANWCQEFNETR